MGLWLLCMTLAGGCKDATPSLQEELCHVVLEEGTGFQAAESARTVKKGEDLRFRLALEPGYLFESADYPDYTVSYGTKADVLELTVHEVKYSTVISVSVRKADLLIRYHANGGQWLQGKSGGQVREAAALSSHQRINTLAGADLLSREGYTLTGWNTEADGSGAHIGLGSRVWPEENLLLYAEWQKWTDASLFCYEAVQDQVIITGYDGAEEVLCIPARIEGKPVISVKEGAFFEASCRIAVIPPTMRNLEAGAFQNCAMEQLYLFDNIVSLNDYSFEGCENLRTLYVNAVEAPVYSGTYFDTFSDKYDRLVYLKEKKKIVLFSGSSTRFGYDSGMISEAFPEYEVVNMGVFAYTNAAPQLLLILPWMQEGDILLHAPEFDAAKRQFCTTNDLDAPFYCMMESNYDAIAQLDLRMVNKAFSALYAYLAGKEGMQERGYHWSAADFDEDGNPSDTKSYNEYGDYVLYRPDAATEEPVYGLEVAYTKEAFPKAYYLEPANAMYQKFLDKGVQVYVTYAPRNRKAVSKESTKEARAQLDRYLKEELIVPVISDLEKSLVSGTYLYKTDNHLSTEGVTIRTKQIIADLKAQKETEKLQEEQAVITENRNGPAK